MALVFVVETGQGLSNSTSYVSVAEADDYLSVKADITMWAALTEQQKQNFLMWATRLLDQRATFAGIKAVATSALRWPRQGVADRDGVAIPYDVVPDPVKDATIEIAFHILSQDVDPSAPISTSGEIKRIKADVLEIEYVDKTQSSTVNYFPVGINDILAGLGSIQTPNGSRFGRILRA